MENPIKKVDAELIAELRVKHGEVVHLVNDDAEAVFRRAQPHEWQQFIDEIFDPEAKARATKQLVFAAVVYPDPKEFTALVNRLPGLVQAFGPPLMEFNGQRRATAKKW